MARVEPPTQVAKCRVSSKHQYVLRYYNIVCHNSCSYTGQTNVVCYLHEFEGALKGGGAFVWLLSTNINKVSPESYTTPLKGYYSNLVLHFHKAHKGMVMRRYPDFQPLFLQVCNTGLLLQICTLQAQVEVTLGQLRKHFVRLQTNCFHRLCVKLREFPLI